MMRREEERVRWEVVAGVAEGDLLTTMSAFGSTTSSQSRITKNKLIDLNSRYSGKIEKANPLVAQLLAKRRQQSPSPRRPLPAIIRTPPPLPPFPIFEPFPLSPQPSLYFLPNTNRSPNNSKPSLFTGSSSTTLFHQLFRYFNKLILSSCLQRPHNPRSLRPPRSTTAAIKVRELPFHHHHVASWL